MERSKGVALIQVLLITGMLLILAIQLSKETKRQVNIATLMKSKGEFTMKLFNEKERLKFTLLTSTKSESQGLGSVNFNFRGVPQKITGDITLTLQDEDGLMSLPYGGKDLARLIEAGASGHETLLNYQGLGQRQSSGDSIRGGLLPSLNEVNLIEGVKVTDVNLLTHLPTFQFNLYNSPESLLQRLFETETAEQIRLLQAGNNTNILDWPSVVKQSDQYMVSKLPGNYLKIRFRAYDDSFEVIRRYRIMVNYDQEPVITEIAVK